MMPAPMIEDDVVTVTPMTASEARRLTDDIKRAADGLWTLVFEAYQRQAWVALGYTSWRAYATAEFGKGQSHVYRLLDQGRVIRALEAAANSPVGEIVTERGAREIKPHLTLVTSAIRKQVAEGVEPDEAVKTAIAGARNQYSRSRKRAERPSKIIENTVSSLQREADYLDLEIFAINLDALDRRCCAQWAAELRDAARKVSRRASRLASRLERLAEQAS